MKNNRQPLINWEINLNLTWYENCVVTNKATRDADPDADPAIVEVYGKFIHIKKFMAI